MLKRSFAKIRKDEKNDIQLIAFFTIIAYLISAMFGNSMYYTSPYFFILLGFLMHEITKNKEKTKDKQIIE